MTDVFSVVFRGVLCMNQLQHILGSYLDSEDAIVRMSSYRINIK